MGSLTPRQTPLPARTYYEYYDEKDDYRQGQYCIHIHIVCIFMHRVKRF